MRPVENVLQGNISATVTEKSGAGYCFFHSVEIIKNYLTLQGLRPATHGVPVAIVPYYLYTKKHRKFLYR